MKAVEFSARGSAVHPVHCCLILHSFRQVRWQFSVSRVAPPVGMLLSQRARKLLDALLAFSEVSVFYCILKDRSRGLKWLAVALLKS